MNPRDRILGLLRRYLWRLRPPVLALGGGGARGFAHLGVLEALETAGLRVRAIAGTSMGSLIGGMVLVHGSARDATARWREALEAGMVPTVRNMRVTPDGGKREHPMVQVARRIRDRIVISFAVNRATMLDGDNLDQVLDFLVPDVVIEDLPRPFLAVATDLRTGDEVRLGTGSLRRAIRASSAIPGLFPAIEIGGRLLVDGGVLAEVPVAAARTLGRPILAIDASMDLPPMREGDLVLDTMIRTQNISGTLLRGFQMQEADHLLRPEVGHATWADWEAFDGLVEAGRAVTRTWLGIAPPAVEAVVPEVAVGSSSKVEDSAVP
jgi:NTE family protein